MGHADAHGRTTPGAPASGAAGDPLTPDHRRELADADARVRKVMAAAGVANFNAWAAAVFGVVGVIGGLFDTATLVVGAAMCVVAWNEFRGRAMVRALDRRGPRLLGWNQVGLFGVVAAYCVWSVYVGLTGPNELETEMARNPELAPVLGPFAGLNTMITLAVYGGVIVASVVFQGLNAWYYFRRVGMLERYLAETPAWVVDLQRRSV